VQSCCCRERVIVSIKTSDVLKDVEREEGMGSAR
jgi:hypothetical protein